MSKNSIIILTCILFLASCKKNTCKYDMEPFCTVQVQNSPDVIVLTTEDQNHVKELFDSSNIDYSNYQFASISVTSVRQMVTCRQFSNGLRLFSENHHYDFNPDGSRRPYIVNPPLIGDLNMGTQPVRRFEELVSVFREQIKNDPHYGNNQCLLYGCFEVELGYYDTSFGAEDKEFELVWLIVSLEQGSLGMFIKDSSLQGFSYFNGIYH